MKDSSPGTSSAPETSSDIVVEESITQPLLMTERIEGSETIAKIDYEGATNWRR